MGSENRGSATVGEIFRGLEGADARQAAAKSTWVIRLVICLSEF